MGPGPGDHQPHTVSSPCTTWGACPVAYGGTRSAVTATQPSGVTSSSFATTRTSVTSFGRSPIPTRSSAHLPVLDGSLLCSVSAPGACTWSDLTILTPAGVRVPNSSQTPAALPALAATATATCAPARLSGSWYQEVRRRPVRSSEP